jgi:hypothetical protein
MPGWEAVEVLVLRHIVDSDRLPLSKKHAKHTMAAGQIADSSPRLVVDSRGDETLQMCSRGVEDAQRTEARGGEPRSHLYRPLQDILERRLGPDRG